MKRTDNKLKELTLKRDRSTSKHRAAVHSTAQEPSNSKNSNDPTTSNQIHTSGNLESNDIPLKRGPKKQLVLKTRAEVRTSLSGHKPLSPKSPRKIPVLISPRPASPSPTAASPRQLSAKSSTPIRTRSPQHKLVSLVTGSKQKSPQNSRPPLASPKTSSKLTPAKLQSPKAKSPSLRSSAAKSPKQSSAPRSLKPLSTSMRSPQVLISTPLRSSARSGLSPNTNRAPSTASPAKERSVNEEDLYVLEVSKPSMDVTFNN